MNTNMHYVDSEGDVHSFSIVNYQTIENHYRYAPFTKAMFELLNSNDCEKACHLMDDYFFTIKFLEYVFNNTISTGLFKQRISCLINYAKRNRKMLADVIYK